MELFDKGLDAREIARKLRFQSTMEMADFVRNNGYIWNVDKNNYDFTPPEEESTNTEEVSLSNGFISEFYSKYADILNLLANNKEKLELLLNSYTHKESVIPRYKIPGVKVTKLLHLQNSLDMLCKEFSERNNISQKDIIIVALDWSYTYDE